MAGTEQERLEEAGYTVTDISDAPETACTAKYCVYMMNNDKPATAEALKAFYNKEELKSKDELTVPLYYPNLYDFVVIVGTTTTTTTN